MPRLAVLHGSNTTWFQTLHYCRAKVEFNSINWVQHGSSTTFETGLIYYCLTHIAKITSTQLLGINLPMVHNTLNLIKKWKFRCWLSEVGAFKNLKTKENTCSWVIQKSSSSCWKEWLLIRQLFITEFKWQFKRGFNTGHNWHWLFIWEQS